MSSSKTNKSFTKRLKVTRNGKIMARKAGFNHFNARQRRVSQLAGKKPIEITLTPQVINRNLPHTKNI